jgi:hypothetical protein
VSADPRSPRVSSRLVPCIPLTSTKHEAAIQADGEGYEGKAFVIAKAGKPLAKVTALETPAAPKRIGFLGDRIVAPDDFDKFGIEEVAVLFGTRK